MTVTELSQSVHITWSLRFFEGAPVNYTIEVTNIDINEYAATDKFVVTERRYVLIGSASKCEDDIFRVKITAVNLAGSSGPVERTVRVPPALDSTHITNSLRYNLYETPNGVVLNVTFEVRGYRNPRN